MIPRSLSTAMGVAMVTASLSGCGAGSAGPPERGVDFVVSIEGTSSEMVIDYSLTNTGDKTLVAYNRVENSGSHAGFVSDVERVYVTREDDQVEIAKKIDHPCHDHPDWDDCSAEEPVTWRIGGSLLEPGEQLSEHIELPARGEPGFVETRGALVRFCLGVAAIDEDNPASPDGLYPPTSPQTVLCSDPVAVAEP